jgi:hypothetical protein
MERFHRSILLVIVISFATAGIARAQVLHSTSEHLPESDYTLPQNIAVAVFVEGLHPQAAYILPIIRGYKDQGYTREEAKQLTATWRENHQDEVLLLAIEENGTVHWADSASSVTEQVSYTSSPMLSQAEVQDVIQGISATNIYSLSEPFLNYNYTINAYVSIYVANPDGYDRYSALRDIHFGDGFLVTHKWSVLASVDLPGYRQKSYLENRPTELLKVGEFSWIQSMRLITDILPQS